MNFKSGERVEIVRGPFAGHQNCFVQRAATPGDNFAGLDRTGQYLINSGSSTFIPGWEAGFWCAADELLSDSQRAYVERDLLDALAKCPIPTSLSIYFDEEAMIVLRSLAARGLVEHTLRDWRIAEPDYDAHVAAQEKARNATLDQQEAERGERNPDTGHDYGENIDGTINLDTEHNDSQ